MKRIWPLFLLLLSSIASADACDARVDLAYIEVQTLEGVALSAQSQLTLRDILQDLCTSREDVVTKTPGQTRYSTINSRDREIRAREIEHNEYSPDPLYIGIDWFSGRAGAVRGDDAGNRRRRDDPPRIRLP